MEVWLNKRERAQRLGGVTLIELLVTMGLLSLIMVLLFQVLIPGLQIWKHARAVADIEQQCMAAEDRIARTVMSTVGGSIRSASTPALEAISMLGHGGTAATPGYRSDTGNPDWKRVEIFYVRPSDGVLYQTHWEDGTGPSLPYNFADGTFQLTVAQLIGLAGSSGQQQHRLAEKVTELRLTPASDETPPIESEGFVLRLSLSTDVPRGQKSIAREVFLVPRLRERE
jgi:type II secretory pathway pseudopilin PulG